MDELDSAIAASEERAFALLEALVAEPSTLGHEGGAQERLADSLAAAGFSVERLFIPEDIASDPAAGVSTHPALGRYDVIGTRGASTPSRTLVLNGHMDVVPAGDPARWTHAPFAPTREDGWLIGRGAGDMKAGFAVALLALWALDEARPGWLGDGRLTFVSAIEEESTGNGTLSAGRAGHLADAALLLEPTDLDLLLGGVSLIWIEIVIEGRAGHASGLEPAVNPIVAARPVIEALLALEREMNATHAANGEDADPAFAQLPHPYNVNIGAFHSGDWPSSVPATARLDVRVGHPRQWTSEETLARVREAVTRAVADDPWLVAHPPTIRLSGYRAERYFQDPDHELVRSLADAHRQVHGSAPGTTVLGATTDARFYVNQFDMPAVAYGPRTRNLHGDDEAVELASIVEAARAVARFLETWFRA